MEDKLIPVVFYFTDGLFINKQYNEKDLLHYDEQLTTYGLYFFVYGQVHKVDNILIPVENSGFETLDEYFENTMSKKQVVKKQPVKKSTTRKTRATKSKA